MACAALSLASGLRATAVHLVAVGLGFHALPGFDNPRVVGPVRFTPDAVPFSMHLNLDKPLAGFWRSRYRVDPRAALP